MNANNFGALRLIAAGMVIFGHSFVITGRQAPAWFGVPVHTLAVGVFFSISGYLIAASWQSDPSLPRFALRRGLRIMPGLVAAVLATVLLLGPLLTRLPLAAYASSPETRLYLWNAALAPYFSLPGVFQDGRPFAAVNGSLWSLPVEAAMYALLPLYGGRGRLARRAVLPAVAVAALGAAYAFTVAWPDQVQPVVYWTSVPFALRFALAFVLGALARSWRLERLLDPQAALLVLAALGMLPPGPLRGAAVLVGVPYVSLAFGLARAPRLSRVGRRDDLSYGLYLWGCPVQQALVSAFGLGMGPYALTGAALLVAGGAALLSWRLVERPCLLLKPRRRARDRAAPPAQPEVIKAGITTS